MPQLIDNHCILCPLWAIEDTVAHLRLPPVSSGHDNDFIVLNQQRRVDSGRSVPLMVQKLQALVQGLLIDPHLCW